MNKQEHLLTILYDMSQTIGSEMHLHSLLIKTLQRLMYHTGYSCGLVLAGAGDHQRLEVAIGERQLQKHLGESFDLPFLAEQNSLKPSQIPDLGMLPVRQDHYKTLLTLPVPDYGTILLLGVEASQSDLPFKQVFSPILANLSKTIRLCQHSEAYTAGLIADRDEVRSDNVRFRQALDTSSDYIFLIDSENTQLIDFNLSATRTLDYSHEEMLKLHLHELIAECTSAFVSKLLHRLESNTKGELLESSCKRKNGTQFPVDIRFSLLPQKNKSAALIAVVSDITERKLADTNLYNAQQLAETTLKAIGDAMITTDEHGLINRMNPVAEQLTGWSEKEAQGQSVKNIFPIVDASTREPIENPVEKVIASGETVYLSNHTTLISKDGTEYQIADSAAPIRDEGNNILGMVLIFNDITEQYQLRQSVTTNMKKYQTLAVVAPVGIFHTDKQGRCLYINEKWSEITGLSAEEAMGEGWAKNIHPDDSERVFAEWNKSTKQSVPFKLEYRFQRPDSVRWVLGQALAEEGEDGEIIGYVGTITDITDRKNTEQTLAKSTKEWAFAMDFFEDAIYLIDLDDKLVRANQAFYKMTGLTPELAAGRDITTIMHPKGEKVPCPVCKARTERRDEIIILEADHPDNPVGKPIQVTVQIIRNSEGYPLSVLMGVRDLSKIRQAEEEEIRLHHQLHQSQKMDALGKLTGGIAHDYNNMLGVIIGYSDLLTSALNEQPKLMEYAKKIQHAGERGSKLTRKLLAFSRYKASEANCLNINTLLLNEQNLLEKTLTVRIKLVFNLAQDIWMLWLDASDMEDAVLNISINAAHAIKGTGQLTIRTNNEHIDELKAQTLSLTPGDYVSLSITDTGCGMDNTIKEQIFEPFFSTKGEQGTGLGLSQVYGFVQRSGGAINVYSKPDHGTQITLYFPRHHETEHTELTIEKNDSANIRGTETILMVDDESALLSLSYEIISPHGFNVLLAKTAKEALTILEHETVDLLITDIIMPEMDGHQLAAIVKEKYPAIKIQLASGFTSNSNADLVDESLQQNLLLKPYNSQALLQRIRDLLNGK